MQQGARAKLNPKPKTKVDSSNDSGSQDGHVEVDRDSFSQHNMSKSEDRKPPINCLRCGRPGHEDKTLDDQCRLMTAILGHQWGSQNKAYTKHKKEAACYSGKESHTTKKTKELDVKENPSKRTPVFPLTSEAWGEEMDLLTRFNNLNLGIVPSTRPRLSKRTTKKPVLE